MSKMFLQDSKIFAKQENIWNPDEASFLVDDSKEKFQARMSMTSELLESNHLI